jgi:hypothetical protein
LRIAVISSFIASITASEEEDDDDDDKDDGVFVFSASDNDEGGEEEASVAFRVKSLKSLPPSPVNEGDENDAFARYDSASKKEDEDEEAIVCLSLFLSLYPRVCICFSCL